MNDPVALIEPFLAHDPAAQAPAVLAWRPAKDVRADRVAWLQMQARRCTEMDFARIFCSGRPSEGARPRDYLQRVVRLDDTHHFLAGIRFRGGGPPFVDVVATTWGWDRLDEVWSVVAREWAVFKPFGLRVMASAPPSSATLRVERDQYLMAGQVGGLSGRPRSEPARRIELRPCSAAVAYPVVHEGYESLSVGMRSRVIPATLEQLEACFADGALRQIWVDDLLAGVIGVENQAEFGLRGSVVIEEILTRPFRGQRLAAAAQRAMIDFLSGSDPDQAIFGTIDATNEPSWRTALRTGRVEIASYWWLFAS